MRSQFEKQLSELNDALIEMGETVKKAIADADKALFKQDTALARKIMEEDVRIDGQEKEIESLCLRLLLQQHPVAGDLRFVAAALKVTTDLERIGDHAADISEYAIALSGQKYIKELVDIPKMAKATAKMASESIEAFVRKDIEAAKKVIADDEEVDVLFKKVKADLTRLIKKNADNCDQAADLLMIAKYFERIGDHATNIAEWLIFLLTGTHKDSRIF